MIIFHTIFLLTTVTAVIQKEYSPKKKSGTCPKETHAELAVCKEECKNDQECPGVQLCCRLSACSTYCRSPVGHQGGTRTSLVLTDSGSHLGASGIGSSRGMNDNLGAHSSSSGTGATGREHSSSAMIRGSSSGMSSVVSLDDHDCNHVCGQGKSCPSGHKCVIDGCRSYCVETSGGAGLSDTLRRGSSVSGIIRSSSSSMSSGIRDSSRLDNNCDYACGVEKPCQSGYKCVQEGCNSYCVQGSGGINSIPQLSETLTGRNNNAAIIRSSSSGGHGMTRVSSINSASSIKCVNDCGDIPCESGYKCVHEGCSSYCVKTTSGAMIGSSGGHTMSEMVGGSHSGMSSSSSGRNTASGIARNSHSAMSSGSSGVGRSSTKCTNECGQDLACGPGYACVHEGCSSFCARKSSVDMTGTSGHSSIESLDVSGSTHNVGGSRSSGGHLTGSDILDAISVRGSGTDTFDTSSSRRGGSVNRSGSRIGSQSTNAGKTDCRKLCDTNTDCKTPKVCVSVNCHRFCRRRSVTNSYAP
ncbi:uncharacterized protein LOC134724726 [Mytilus trossulus]|uniref:uncharacterized protein LOC134724726 n=1 Tax=Mytilus trossulus TaxID=6551 RepID=UPI003004A7AC